jgi:PAS domain S-box-containing protein
VHDEDRYLLEAVSRFVGAGLGAGDSVIAIATDPHLRALEQQLASRGFDLATPRAAGRYVTLDAAATLARITVAGQPDAEHFAREVGGLIRRAAAGGAPVRVFGEMVSLLCADGKPDAALRLEELWNELRAGLHFSLLCAYPLGFFAREPNGRSFLRICAQHGGVLPAESGDTLTSEAERLRMVAYLEPQAGVRRGGDESLEQAAETSARLAAIVESADDAIVGKTLDGVVTSWNRAAERIFGFSAEEMIGQSISRIIPPERQDDFPMILGAVRRGERVDHYETERVRKDGRRIFVSLTVSPILDAAGQVVGVSKIARDVTERHRLEAQREQLAGIVQRSHAELAAANRAKDEFLAMLGHELRNPLGAVRNAVESAQLDPTMRERALEIASRQAKRLARLVDDLLDVARLAQGGVRLNRETVPLAEILGHALESTQFSIEQQGHTLSVTLPSDELRVDCDPLRLEQVLVNLLSNAAKYTPRGGHVELSGERENGHAVIRVRDDGVGIAADELARIFEPFVQAPRPRDHSAGGLGVGLTIARSFVVLHGGTIEVFSAGPGAGAEFVVRLPAAPDAVERTQASPFVPKPSPAKGMRILVVDDNADAAEGVAMLLEVFGYCVMVAVDGPQALEAARTQPPDVMLVDIGLPGMDGYEVARRVRAIPELSGVVLVALTGFGLDEDRRRARDAGFDHHLTKPVAPAVLRSVIAQLGASLAGSAAPGRW